MRRNGFTLIELMVVVIIVAILAAIAYPSYQAQVRKGRRADAKIALMNTAQVLERCYTEFHAYNSSSCAAVSGGALASGYTSSRRGYYTISATTLSTSAFTLQAVPTGPQAGDRCGNFKLTHAGQKQVTGDGDGDGDSGDADDVNACW